MPVPKRAAAPDDLPPVSEVPAALQKLEANIASVFLARLDGLFAPDALGLGGGTPREDSFLGRIGKPAFWTCALCKKDQVRYSPAVQFHLQRLFSADGPMSFHDYCQVWGQSFYAARHDGDSARDLLLLFLDQNLRSLKELYILEQPHNQDLTPETRAVQRCLEASANAMLFVGDRFSRWVLDDWLPFHLRYVCCRGFNAPRGTPLPECGCSVLGGVSVTWN
ncbi:MAG TPA: hypothetical protein VEC01_16840 [Noviherbaspirillum sp.]|uniref:hypothetical protein n=1 Tax=Noviherbaspirillum sp. TaxID=1926288 RepID=UPI002D5048DF|nr:hypothetical protein [Noviherbaspirillum sp.]HYD96998.1 hypothetical protein [Noviherbaspirillum sp.]